MTDKIFINYRRGDEPGFTQALLGRLEQAFPAERLFIDVDNIPAGEDFVRVLESQVGQCAAMLTVIGSGWLNATDERGNRRLDDPNDFVRIEIESALKQGKRVIPVLVHDARMPRADELPEAIRPLASRNAVRLTHERFRADVHGLIKSLQGAVAAGGNFAPDEKVNSARPRGGHSRRFILAMFTVCIVAVGCIGIWFANSGLISQFLQTKSSQPAQQQPVSALPATAAPSPSAPQLTAPAPANTRANLPPAQKSSVQPAPSDTPDPAGVEIAFWNSIKDSKNQQLFEAYLKRYPNGAFADIARITLDGLKKDEQKSAALMPPAQQQIEDATPVNDPASLNELRERLYELNFDTGPLDGPLTDAAHEAIREFQQQIGVPPTGAATMGLLRRLRQLGGLKPWGAIVYGKNDGKWGMAWDETSRKAAVAHARASCGNADSCSVEVSFFGDSCGVFAYSDAGWAITAREGIANAKQAALADCGKRGKSCQVIATVCADGTDRSGGR